MVFYILILVGSIVAGMGIGGGSIFLLLTSIFNTCDFYEAQIYNLILFIAVGMSSLIYSIKNKEIDLNILKKIIFFVILGSIGGSILGKIVEKDLLQKIFLVFMALMGIYEIISSLKNMISAKNNSSERSW